VRQLRIQYVDGIYRSNYPWPWNLGQGSLKVTGNGTIGKIIHDLVELFDVEYYRDLEMWVRGHSRSLKMVPFDSLGMVSYSPITVGRIFSDFGDIQRQRLALPWNMGWGRSRSFKMARFSRPCTTFYWSAIVTITPSCTILELFDVE